MKTFLVRKHFLQTLQIACIGLLISAARFGQAQIVSFPDPALETAVRNALNIGTPTNITVANMQTLTNFYCGFQGIQNLTGLDKATSLVQLDMYGNQVTNIAPLAGLTNLLFSSSSR